MQPGQDSFRLAVGAATAAAAEAHWPRTSLSSWCVTMDSTADLFQFVRPEWLGARPSRRPLADRSGPSSNGGDALSGQSIAA